MSEPAKRVEETIGRLVKKVQGLDDEALWMFVCKLFPGADVDFLEDIFDTLSFSRLETEPTTPLEEIVAEEDRRRGITR